MTATRLTKSSTAQNDDDDVLPVSHEAAHSDGRSDEATHGLSSIEAGRLLARHGPNELARDKAPSPLKAFAAQWKGAMVWLLLAATVMSALLGEVADAVAIAVILLVNALIGFVQELRAERAVHALRQMTAPHARVVRDGRVVDVASRDVVPGDHLVLDAGDIVAADGRLLEANAMLVNEAALTGESMPVEKSVGVDDTARPLAERTGSLFAGTAIERGTGRARVETTGMATELGRIARLLNATQNEVTPLQRRLEGVGRALLLVCVGVVALVAIAGFARGMAPMELLLTSVSLAVAAVPEGLAAIVTIALAIGVKRMVARNVLIRRLQAVETLGCATVICTDKTGTLTTGKMAVRDIWSRDRRRALDVMAQDSLRRGWP
jgi:P-type Ca2+ transporter type 2C